MMSSMPGIPEVCTSDTNQICDATCRAAGGCEEPTSLDYDEAKVVLWDLRLKDKVLEWPMSDCGNGIVNATAFEECDYAASPNPIENSNNYMYPENT